MNTSNPKVIRFIKFIDQTLSFAAESIVKNKILKKDKNGMRMKFVIQDVQYVRYLTVLEDKYLLDTKKPDDDIPTNCYMTFDKAKTLHLVLIGKVSPLNLSLVGRVTIIYKNAKSRLFANIYTPGKEFYQKLTKGTRFTLKK